MPVLVTLVTRRAAIGTVTAKLYLRLIFFGLWPERQGRDSTSGRAAQDVPTHTARHGRDLPRRVQILLVYAFSER